MTDLHLRDEAATRELGRLVARSIEPGDVILLLGELGAGKTTFAKGFVRELGATTSVTSPTFTLCHIYDCEPVVAHLDCWRLSDVDEVIDLGIEEVLDDGGVALIEWGELAKSSFGDQALEVSLSMNSIAAPTALEDSEPIARTAVLQASGKSWTRRLAELHRSFQIAGLFLLAKDDPT